MDFFRRHVIYADDIRSGRCLVDVFIGTKARSITHNTPLYAAFPQDGEKIKSGMWNKRRFRSGTRFHPPALKKQSAPYKAALREAALAHRN